VSDDLDPATREQLEMDRADAAYEEQCWRADRDELHGWFNDHPTLDEFLKDDRKYRHES